MDEKVLDDAYKKYINSPKWQAKRSERLKIDNYTCQKCGELRGLHVHHVSYKNFGNENVYEDLITLCEKCHKTIEGVKAEKDKKEQERCARLEEEHKKESEARKAMMKSMSLNSLYFIDHASKRDIGFGGEENLCNIQHLTKTLEKCGLKREEVFFGQIQHYFAQHRWIMARNLYKEGLNVYQVAEKMKWKPDKIMKAINDEQFENLTTRVNNWLADCYKAIGVEED